MKRIQLYSAPSVVDIGDRKDNDPPVAEPVFRFEIPNAIITPNGYVIDGRRILKQAVSYRHRNDLHLRHLISFRFLKKKVKTVNKAISICSGWYNGYYHFVLECLPKLFLIKEEIETSVLVFPLQRQRYHEEWLSLLGVKNILHVNDSEVVHTPMAITTSFPARDLNHHPVITPLFAQWVLEKVKQLPSPCGKKIFIGRKNARHRKLLHESDVLSLLNKYGFETVFMEDHSVSEQVRIFRDAAQIVCVHGAALSNLCFSSRNTKVIDMMHEEFHQWCFLKLSLILKIDYTILWCKGNGDHPLPGYKDIEVDTQVLEERIKSWQ